MSTFTVTRALDAHNCNPKRTAPGKWAARCPAHEDRVASLSVSEGDDGRVLLHCFAGCGLESEILPAIGLTIRDLFAAEPAQTTPTPPPNPEALPGEIQFAGWIDRLAGGEALWRPRAWSVDTLRDLGIGYDGVRLVIPVRDAAGALINVLRYGGKPKMIALRGRPRGLFPPPESVAGDPLWIVEGEPDAISAATLGLPAVAIPGANGWRAEYAPRFAGRSVVVCMDCDAPGRAAAGRVARALLGYAAEVRVLDIAPARDDGHDLSDLFDGDNITAARELLMRAAGMVEPMQGPAGNLIGRGGRVRSMVEIASGMRGADDETILAALRAANRRCRPPLSEVELRSAAHSVGRYDDALLIDTPSTDVGNARVLAAANGHALRYVTARRKWFAYIDGLWRPDETGHAERAAKTVAHERALAALTVTDADKRKRLMAWAFKSQNGPQQRELLRLAQSEGGIALRAVKLDRDPWLLAVANGTLDLRTGRLRAHDPDNLISLGSAVAYDPDATSPRWRRFLEEVFAGDGELVSFVQRAAGYSLTGDTREQVLFIAHGSGANGKSVFLGTIARLLGDLAQTASFEETFARSRNARAIRNDLARLHGARMVSATESAESRRFDEEVVKGITGGDVIVARFLHAEHFEFRPQFKLWLATNHRPRIDADAEAMWRRIRLVPFEVSFRGREDRGLEAALRAELPGILRWAVDGCLAWQADGLGHAAAVTRATEAYLEHEDVVAQFLDDRTYPSDGRAKSAEIFAAYERFCEEIGERPTSKRALSEAIVKRRPDVRLAKSGNARYLVGISLEPSLNGT